MDGSEHNIMGNVENQWKINVATTALEQWLNPDRNLQTNIFASPCSGKGIREPTALGAGALATGAAIPLSNTPLI